MNGCNYRGFDWSSLDILSDSANVDRDTRYILPTLYLLAVEDLYGPNILDMFTEENTLLSIVSLNVRQMSIHYKEKHSRKYCTISFWMLKVQLIFLLQLLEIYTQRMLMVLGSKRSRWATSTTWTRRRKRRLHTVVVLELIMEEHRINVSELSVDRVAKLKEFRVTRITLRLLHTKTKYRKHFHL